jgi:uncharacterized protein
MLIKLPMKLVGKWSYVDATREAIDLYSMNHAKENDITITQDIGLASVLVNSNIKVRKKLSKLAGNLY